MGCVGWKQGALGGLCIMQVRKEQRHARRSHSEGRGKRTEGMSVTDVAEVLRTWTWILR